MTRLLEISFKQLNGPSIRFDLALKFHSAQSEVCAEAQRVAKFGNIV